MKIEIDLKDILLDEDYGPESMQDSIRRQVIANIEKTVVSGIGKKIDIEIAKAIDDKIKKSLDEIMPSLINEIIDAEYFPVSNYGDRAKEPTTFRKQLIKCVTENMVYKNSGYSSDRNAFTNAVNAVLDEKIKMFQKEFNSLVDKEYVEKTKEFAAKTLKEKLGFK